MKETPYAVNVAVFVDPSTNVLVTSGNGVDVPAPVMTLRRFQLACWKRASSPTALSSANTEMAQSRNKAYGVVPSAAVRFAIPAVFELTRLNHSAPSAPAGEWSAAKRRKFQIAPRVDRSSSNESKPMGAWDSVRPRYCA